MNKISDLNNKNNYPIYSVRDGAFRTYGRVIEGIDTSELIAYMEQNTAIPEEGNVYVASVPAMEDLPVVKQLSEAFYGGMPIQAGYCNGKNSTLNGLEYHKGSEINIAATDFVLMLGHIWDITEDLEYASNWAQVFYVEKGTAIELYQTTLHLSPCRTCEDGFKACVILPEGTNTPLTDEEKSVRNQAYAQRFSEAGLLLERNKWVIAHPEREALVNRGAHPGVLGENRELVF